MMALSVSIFIVIALISGHAQQGNSVFVADQEVHVRNLSGMTAPSYDLSRVLATALEIALRDQAVCCGKDSAPEDALLGDPRSLKELGGRIERRHLLSDGRPIMIAADFVPRNSVHPELIIGALRQQRVPLIEWKSHFYLVYGVIYNETIDNGGVSSHSIHKLLLLDVRYSDARREFEFDRETDDWDKVEGLLIPVVSR
jgi:hypothetical protein